MLCIYVFLCVYHLLSKWIIISKYDVTGWTRKTWRIRTLSVVICKNGGNIYKFALCEHHQITSINDIWIYVNFVYTCMSMYTCISIGTTRRFLVDRCWYLYFGALCFSFFYHFQINWYPIYTIYKFMFIYLNFGCSLSKKNRIIYL